MLNSRRRMKMTIRELIRGEGNRKWLTGLERVFG